VRWSEDEKLVVISNFNAENTYGFELQIPSAIIEKWNLEAGEYEMKDQLYKSYKTTLKVEDEKAYLRIDIKPLESFILKLE
jgi:hypothetical protein